MHKLIVTLLILAALGATTLVVLNVARRPAARTPPQVAAPRLVTNRELPPFELTERSGEAVSLASLRGKVWIANFIFTRCTGPCPVLTSRMYMVQDELKDHPKWDDIRLVTITVDPDHDTPPVLAERAELALADPAHWLWLTGSRNAVWSLITDGFALPVEENNRDSEMPIIHSGKFVLVDAVGTIRGYYDGMDDASRAALLGDLDQLLP
jgi:cytochrome oxidase Cu insertion factor (SCO1/SenC/PrrC family)